MIAWRALLSGSLLLATSAFAAGPELRFETYKLENGLTVVLSEDHQAPEVAIDVLYGAGL